MSEKVKMKLGDPAKFVVPDLVGFISGKKFDEESDSFMYALTWADSEGTHTKWFNEGEVVPDTTEGK